MNKQTLKNKIMSKLYDKPFILIEKEIHALIETAIKNSKANLNKGTVYTVIHKGQEFNYFTTKDSIFKEIINISDEYIELLDTKLIELNNLKEEKAKVNNLIIKFILDTTNNITIYVFNKILFEYKPNRCLEEEIPFWVEKELMPLIDDRLAFNLLIEGE